MQTRHLHKADPQDRRVSKMGNGMELIATPHGTYQIRTYGVPQVSLRKEEFEQLLLDLGALYIEQVSLGNRKMVWNKESLGWVVGYPDRGEPNAKKECDECHGTGWYRGGLFGPSRCSLGCEEPECDS